MGKEPATVDPRFLDNMVAHPDQTYPVKLGGKEFVLSLADIIYDSPKGNFPHPNTMTCQLVAGNDVIYELEYCSVGGGFIEWKGYTPPKKGQPKYPYATMEQLRQHAEANNISIADVIIANEITVGGKNKDQINAFLDKIAGAMLATVKSGLSVKDDVLPGPIKLHAKAATVWARAMDEKYESDRAIGLVAACALAASEENARGHLVITAPTGGSAGVMPAIVSASWKASGKSRLSRYAAAYWLARRSATFVSTTPRSPALREVARLKLAWPRPCPPRWSPRPWAVRRRRSKMPPNPPWKSPRPHLRSGCWIRPGAVHRALCVRRRKGVDRFYDREQ